MDIVLVPGFWLDGASWDAVTPALTAAGHRVNALTLPGLESVDADRSEVSLADHVAAVVAAVDAADGPVALVAHSGGAAPVHGAVDARPKAVVRAVYVDCVPIGHGAAVNRDLPVVGGEIPLPAWSAFDEPDLVGLDEGLRAEFRARAVPEPRGPAYDALELGDVRRYDVPITVIACEFGSALIREWVESGQPFVSELGRIHRRTFVDLPTGHWPQFTRPDDLGAAIAAAVDSA
ncbi:alpha/beta hydrolase family protein [Frondihabitans sp. PhB188]|uniref:alpha/beta fold hydrolase n=1 Tax=Frondihabitans sp. PhB188 TaxID=2485200 RepID=UPI000F4AC9DF|nr:alpha/beta hydrolase [Frondihabitans sp. PhB188]ROQ41475.1 alpha/beta hydrolase family protein [Frondihabitans sp. PhB188]